MAGSDGNANNEFIELYNPGESAVSLTGWSIQKKSSGGGESALVSKSRFEGKEIKPHGYFLIAHEGSYIGSVVPDLTWPVSYNIAYTNNAIALYNGSGAKIEEVHWDEIPAGESFVRSSWSDATFSLQPPTPQNSASN